MLKKMYWFLTTDRIGPDILFSQLLLSFKVTQEFLLKKKLKFVGKNVEVRCGVYLIQTNNISLGNNVILRPGTYITANSAEVVIEDDVLLGPNVMIQTSRHSFTNTTIPVLHQGYSGYYPVKICSGAWIGANVVILPGVTIGTNAVIGAGSVVTRDVPPYTLAYGVPCKHIKKII